MPRNGSGGYGLPAGNPVVAGTTISSTDFNNTMTDLATAMAGSVAADGQTAWTGNQNANGNRLTSVGAAASIGDAVNANDVQTGKQTYLTAVAGTNTITATTGMLTAYTAGECFRFIAANTNAGASTLNINSIGAVAITKFGSVALAAGDIKAGQMVCVSHDGTQFQLLSVGTGQLIGVQRISATGTYTPTPGTVSVVVELVGGGGGGGGCAATGAGQIAAGSGGGAGGYAKSRLTSAFSGVTVTVGAAGAGAVGAVGTNGGTTSFGAVFSAGGGSGGAAGTAQVNTTTTASAGGNPGGGASGNLLSANGGVGELAFYLGGVGIGGAGGASAFGAGGVRTMVSGAGAPSGGPGSGGGGGALAASSAANAGGAGGQGICFVWEYA